MRPFLLVLLAACSSRATAPAGPSSCVDLRQDPCWIQAREALEENLGSASRGHLERSDVCTLEDGTLLGLVLPKVSGGTWSIYVAGGKGQRGSAWIEGALDRLLVSHIRGEFLATRSDGVLRIGCTGFGSRELAGAICPGQAQPVADLAIAPDGTLSLRLRGDGSPLVTCAP